MFMSAPLLNILNNGYLLTANSRIARNIQMFLLGESKKNMLSATRVMSVSEWLDKHFKAARDKGFLDKAARVLSDHESLWAWKTIVAEDQSLYSPNKAASLAYSAFKLCKEYNIQISPDQFGYAEDTEVFSLWAAKFSQFLDGNLSTIGSALPGILLQSGYVDLTEKENIFLFGELTVSPLTSALIEKIGGGKPNRYKPRARSASKTGYKFDSPEAELKACASWAVQQSANNPDSVITIVVPDLAKHKDNVIRALRDADNPDHIRPINGYGNVSFNISFGQPYSELPIVRHVGKLLRYMTTGASFYDVTQLVSSPYFTKLSSFSRYIHISQYLLPEDQVKIRGWKRHLPAVPDEVANVFDDILGAFDTGLRMTPYAWQKKLTSMLTDSLGWPGNRGMTTLEYQAIQYWKVFSQLFAAYDFQLREIDLYSFVQLFEHVAANTLFHEESNPSNIHVLGTVEAEGMYTDYMWILEAHDSNFPSKADRNPFIPLDIQVKADIPHCSADKELQYARHLLSSYEKYASEIILSFSSLDSDGRDQFPSPIAGATYESVTKSIVTTTSLVEPKLSPYILRPVPYDSQDRVKGGAYLFKDYVKCGFFAFANHRLGLPSKVDSPFGLSRASQGTILHEMMRHFWDKVKSHKELIEASSEYLRELLIYSCDLAIAKVITKTGQLFSERYLKIERDRQVDIAINWLDIEKLRPPFEVVATEKKVTRTLSGITTNLVIDRIDRDITTKALMFWDYKTGYVSIGDLSIDSPIDPQIPLYVLDEDDVSALGYLKLSNKRTEAVGFAAKEIAFSRLTVDQKATRYGLTTDWTANVSGWKKSLENVADHIYSGAFFNTPVSAQNCRDCSRRWLCRVDEIGEHVEPLHIFQSRYDAENRGVNI